ncbi:hypothetical protein CPB85DRAFT_391679 [Mucidula mucida]|nr:hypothetical protein CPB85DRAFT_391679 [Mucidula mucida]
MKRLIDSHATRTAILAVLRFFQTDSAVEKDKSAIIVFFAGHGASSTVLSHWPAWSASGGKVEQLCSVDIGEMNDNGMLIEGIPDYTIRVLLDELSQAKGDNITLILDCCHSGGMNRAAAQGWVARSIDNPPPLSDSFDLDIDYSQNRGAHVAQGFSGTGRDSHIILAACSRNQFAYEKQGHGLFTTAVLGALSQPASEQLTYASLIHRLVIPYCPVAPQTPHCDGTFRRRRLFDSWSPEGDADVILCHREGTATSFTLEAGAMHGVAVGNQYAIFDTDIVEESSGHLTATVQRVDAFTSVLVPSGASHGQLDSLPHSDGSVGELRYARLRKETSVLLRVYCSDKEYTQSLWRV